MGAEEEAVSRLVPAARLCTVQAQGQDLGLSGLPSTYSRSEHRKGLAQFLINKVAKWLLPAGAWPMVYNSFLNLDSILGALPYVHRSKRGSTALGDLSGASQVVHESFFGDQPDLFKTVDTAVE